MNEYVQMLMEKLDLFVNEKFNIDEEGFSNPYYFDKKGNLFDCNLKMCNNIIQDIIYSDLTITNLNKLPVLSKEEVGMLRCLTLYGNKTICLKDCIFIDDRPYKNIDKKYFKTLVKGIVYNIVDLIDVNEMKSCIYQIMLDLGVSDGDLFEVRNEKYNYCFRNGKLTNSRHSDCASITMLGKIASGLVKKEDIIILPKEEV